MSADTEALLARLKREHVACDCLWPEIDSLTAELRHSIEDVASLTSRNVSLIAELERARAQVKMLTSRNQFLSTEQVRADIAEADLERVKEENRRLREANS